MRIHGNQLFARIPGTLIGVGFLAMGGYAMFGADDTVPAFVRERAWWFGATATIGGIWAIAVSWLDPDLTGVWCRPPRRPRDFGG